MSPALESFDHDDLVTFFSQIGVKTHAPDGFRIFPVTHSSSTIIDALVNEMERLGIEVISKQKVEQLEHNGSRITGVTTQDDTYYADAVAIATGGK